MLLSNAMGSISLLLMYIVIFGAVMYFLTVRPGNKERKAKEEMYSQMKAGDSVLTTSGFYGVIIDIMDNTVIVEFGNNRNCRIPMQKEAIQAVERPDYAKTEEEE